MRGKMSKEIRMAMRKDAVIMLLKTVERGFTREGLKETPDRVARMYEEIFAGYDMNPEEILGKVFVKDPHQELVLMKDIPFYSTCEHHLTPFFGKVHIAYIPKGKIVGISKLIRLVECYSRRLQIQERMTSQLADTIDDILAPLGVAVIVSAEHMCITLRGVRKPGVVTRTAALRGVFFDDIRARSEFYNLLGGKDDSHSSRL